MDGSQLTRTAEVVRSATRRFAAVVRRLAFWTAIVLPVLYLPPLIAGPATTAELSLLGGLIGLHVAAIVVGHDYGTDSGGAESPSG